MKSKLPLPEDVSKKKEVRFEEPEKEVDDDLGGARLPYLVPAQVEPSQEKRAEVEKVPAIYKRQAPISKLADSEELIERILGTKIENTLKDLLGNSEVAAEGIKKLLTKKRQEVKAEVDRQMKVKKSEGVALSQLPSASVFIVGRPDGRVPKGAVRITDPVEEYLQSVGKIEGVGIPHPY